MTEPLTTYILAGGRSSRMGSDKADIMVGGRTMLDHACALAAGVGSDRTLVLGRPCHPLGIPDERPFEGPARAIMAQLGRETTPLRLLVLPVDMPLLKPIQINKLLDQPHGGYFDDMYLPFAARIARCPDFAGERIRDMLAVFGAKPIAFDPAWEECLRNINTPGALAQVETR